MLSSWNWKRNLVVLGHIWKWNWKKCCNYYGRYCIPGLVTDEYLFLLKHSVQNITNGKAFGIPWIIHEYTEQGTNGDFLLVSKLRLKTMPMFPLERQTRLMRKQTRFILTLPVAGAVK